MSTTKAYLLSLAVLWVCTLGFSCNDNVKSDCKLVCERAKKCGLLPSALGAETTPLGFESSSQDNCAGRCTSSKNSNDIKACLDVVAGADSTSDDKPSWCLGQGNGTCGEMAKCLSSILGSPEAFGVGELLILPVHGISNDDNDDSLGSAYPSFVEDDCYTNGCSDEVCRTLEPGEIAGDDGCNALTCNDTFSTEELLELCLEHKITSIEYVVMQRDQLTYNRSVSCKKAVSQPMVLGGLRPGPTRVSLHLHGTLSETVSSKVPDGGTDSSDTDVYDLDAGMIVDSKPFCLVFYSPETVVATGARHRVAIPLPEALDPHLWPYQCEGDKLTCFDGLDNDGDAFVDCADQECSDFCTCAIVEENDKSKRSVKPVYPENSVMSCVKGSVL